MRTPKSNSYLVFQYHGIWNIHKPCLIQTVNPHPTLLPTSTNGPVQVHYKKKECLKFLQGQAKQVQLIFILTMYFNTKELGTLSSRIRCNTGIAPSISDLHSGYKQHLATTLDLKICRSFWIEQDVVLVPCDFCWWDCVDNLTFQNSLVI